MALASIGLAAVWLGGSFFLIDKWQPANTVNLGPLRDGYQVEQVLFAPEDGLARVDLHLDNNGPATTGEIDLVLRELAGGEDGGGLPAAIDDPAHGRAASTSLADVNSFEMHRFDFKPVEDSGGRSFVVAVGADGVAGDGLTLRASGEDVYSGGGLYVDGEAAAGDLNFALYHEAGIGGITDKVEPFRPPLLDQGWLFMGCMILAVLVFGWLMSAMAFGTGAAAPDSLAGESPSGGLDEAARARTQDV